MLKPEVTQSKQEGGELGIGKSGNKKPLSSCWNS